MSFFKIVVLFEQRLNMSYFGSFDRVMDFIEGKMSYEEMIRQLDDLYILQRDFEDEFRMTVQEQYTDMTPREAIFSITFADQYKMLDEILFVKHWQRSPN